MRSASWIQHPHLGAEIKLKEITVSKKKKDQFNRKKKNSQTIICIKNESTKHMKNKSTGLDFKRTVISGANQVIIFS